MAGDGPPIPTSRGWGASRYLHIVSLVLGGLIGLAGLYGQATLASGLAIVVVTVNSIGAYTAQ